MQKINYIEEFENQRAIFIKLEQMINNELEKALEKYNKIISEDLENKEKVLQLITNFIKLKRKAHDIILKKLEFIRPGKEEDMINRYKQYNEFSSTIKGIIPEDLPLRFHGCSIYVARSIINEGQISSSVDRLGYATSYDTSDQISVTTKDSLDITVKGYMDLTLSYMPCGCIFVIMPKDKEDEKAGESLLMGNVDFKNEPNRLVGIITSKENTNQVKKWMVESDLDSSKVFDFDSFITKYTKMKESNQEESERRI